ncbi:MAG: glycosyltransferase family 9 protein [Bacteroidales bacterium]|nr:glycosyltransferase family 9 protein [Bacteroidales bacterium]
MKKILVIRFSSIGDIVLTTPVVRCLKQQLPEAEIHFVTKSFFLPVLKANPYIDKIYSIREKIEEVIPDLKMENYDHIIDLHKNFRSKGVILKLKKPASSFDKINLQKWMAVNLKINSLPNIHIVDRYFEAVKRLGIKNDQKGLDYFIPEEDEIKRESLPEFFRKSYIAWVIGGKHNTKIFPKEKIIETIQKSRKPVILLGGPEDKEKGDSIQITIGSTVFNAAGKYNINQSASLVQQADFVITNDTGLMHVAAAFKKPIVSLWGNTIPEFGMYPYLPGCEENSIILEIKGLSCRPCSKLGFKKCPKGHFKCMQEIETDEIIRSIDGEETPEAK